MDVIDGKQFLNKSKWNLPSLLSVFSQDLGAYPEHSHGRPNLRSRSSTTSSVTAGVLSGISVIPGKLLSRDPTRVSEQVPPDEADTGSLETQIVCYRSHNSSVSLDRKRSGVLRPKVVSGGFEIRSSI